MQNNEILILCNDYEAINDLSNWLCEEFDVQLFSPTASASSATLGENTNGLKVFLDSAKSSWNRLVEILKNWINTFNKDIEISVHNGSKSYELKCPANRITNDQLDKILSSMDDIWKKK